ncbi:Uncharacterized protein At4g04980 [Linum perenne]
MTMKKKKKKKKNTMASLFHQQNNKSSLAGVGVPATDFERPACSSVSFSARWPGKAMPTGIFCGLRPFRTGSKLFRSESTKSAKKKNHQVAGGPKQHIGWVRGGSSSMRSLFVLMMDLRKKIILFRNVFELPPRDRSASMNHLVMETMTDLHNLYPEIIPMKDLLDIKQGISIHEVLIYLCGALRFIGDSWVATDHEWMDETTLYKQSNMDELSPEQLVELALATLNCLIKILHEDSEISNEEDHHSKTTVPRGKMLLKSYSEANTPFRVPSPMTIPTSVLPELSCSSPRAEEFSNLYCSSPILKFLSVQSVGKWTRIDIKKLPFHLFTHGSTHGHHKNNANGAKTAETEAKSKVYCSEGDQPDDELVWDMEGSRSSDVQIDTDDGPVWDMEGSRSSDVQIDTGNWDDRACDTGDKTRESSTVDTIPTTAHAQELTMLSEEHMSSQLISEASPMKEKDTTAASVAPRPSPRQPPPSTTRINMTIGSQPPRPPPPAPVLTRTQLESLLQSLAPEPPMPTPVLKSQAATTSTSLQLTPHITKENEKPSSQSPLSQHIPEAGQAAPPPPPPPPPQMTTDREKPSSSQSSSLGMPRTTCAAPPPPPLLRESSNGSASSRTQPPSQPIDGSTLPPPPPQPSSQSMPRTKCAAPPPPPLLKESSNGSASSRTQPPSQPKDGSTLPPPPPGAAKLLRPRKSNTKLKRSSNMGNLYRVLKGRVEGGTQIRSQNGRGSPNSNNAGGKLGMADALAEITRRSAYFRQIEEDAQTYAEEITRLKRELSSFKTKDMTELVSFYNYVESVLENLTDESQVLARFEGFPQKKLEAIRSAAALFCKLKRTVTDLQAWKIESPLQRLLDKMERYFSKINGEVDAFERIKDEECKKFKSYNIEFDLQILVQIKEAVVDLSSNCMELAIKERKDFENNGAQPSKTCCKTMWRTFQFAFRVYTFAGGHDDRADRLTRELGQQIEEDYRRMQDNQV